MLACVYQQSDSRLYKGGVVTPLVHLGGQRPPRRPPGSVKTKPPKLPPKPQSLSNTSTSNDAKSSPSHKSSIDERIQKSPKRDSAKLTQTNKLNDLPTQGSSENSDKENKQEDNVIIKKLDLNRHTKDNKAKENVKSNVLREHEFRIGKKPRDIPIPHKIIRSITSSVDDKSLSSDVSTSPENTNGRRNNINTIKISNNSVNCLNNMPKGNQEKLLKTKNDPEKRQSQRHKSRPDCMEVSTLQETDSSNDGICNGVVTITDNDGKIYCIDNLILVGEDVFGKIRSEDFSSTTDVVSGGNCSTSNSNVKSGGTMSKCVNRLTVKNKTDSNGITLLADGTKSLELPEGVELTLGELRAMALRQQQQIDCQHQLLAAREQRLRFLKQQEAKHHQVAAENERLRRLRERVEAQELKLRRLRALRGQLDQTNINNVALTSDLESIRALFNEKEKELSVAVAKVEELTRQLEEVRRGRAAPPRPQPPAAQELDKLRRELMYRNKLNEQQNARLSQQREALTARQAEMASIDQRISELQGRLQRKRVANRQMASQISGKHAARSNNPAGLAVSGYPISGQQNNPLSKVQPPRGNIAAVEPYNHIPHAQSVSHNFQALKHNAVQNNASMKHLNQNDGTTNHNIITQQQDGHYLQQQQQKQFTNQNNMFSSSNNNNGSYPQRLQANLIQTDTQFNPSYSKQNDIITNAYPQQGINNQQQMVVQSEQKILLEHINKYNNIDLQKNINHHQQTTITGTTTSINNNSNGKQTRTNIINNSSSNNEQEFLPEFSASKSDPKYQTLPYNTKFSTNNNVTSSSSSNGTTNSKGNKVQFYDDNNTKQSNESSSGTAGIVKTSSSSNVNNILSTVANSNSNLNHMTAHSTPLTIINNKGHAMPLLNNGENNVGGYHIQKSESLGKCNQEEKENLHGNVVRENQQPKVVGEQFKVGGFGGGRAELVRAFSQHTTVTSTSAGQIMKPVSSVAPTTVQVASGKPSPIYQTSSTKIQPVQPQTVSNSLSNNNSNNNNSNVPAQQNVGHSNKQTLQNSSVASLLMSPPQSSSTPMSTPDVSSDKSVPKPALPPKPAPKVPISDLSQTSDSKTSENNTSSIPSTDSQSELESNGQNTPQSNNTTISSTDGQPMIIKARPLTIRKQPLSEQPKLRNQPNNAIKNNSVNIATTRRIEMPSAFLFADMDQQRESSPQSDKGNDNNKTSNGNNKLQHSGSNSCLNTDVVDRANIISSESSETSSEDQSDKNGVSNLTDQMNTVDLNNSNGEVVSRRVKKGNLKQGGKVNLSRRVSFDPLALLLDASLEGELELVKKTATQVANPSAANDEGITALHNAICAGHFEIVKFLVEFGCDVNAQDSDGWTPLHCAASCNNVAMVRFLVENGACIFATTLSDHETAAQKCEEDEEGFDGCSEYLYSVQEKLGIMNGGTVFAVFPYTAHECDELSFSAGSRLSVLRKGDEAEREWWWVHDQHGREGYVPRNLLGLYPRVTPNHEHLQ